jgi:hypothetical protein
VLEILLQYLLLKEIMEVQVMQLQEFTKAAAVAVLAE